MRIIALLLAILVTATGCARDNGLPGDLSDHLAAFDVAVEFAGSDAPVSSRAGMVFFATDSALEQRIIAALALTPVPSGSPEYDDIAGRVEERAAMLWGAAGRPPKLKLRDGGQLEYLYLLRTAAGKTYLIAEYAYG